MPPQRKPHCAVLNCDSVYDGRISFFRFPKRDTERCLEWLKPCGRPALPNKDSSFYHNKLRVCGKHFSDEMFLNHTKDRLLSNARPVNYVPLVVVKKEDNSSTLPPSEESMMSDPLLLPSALNFNKLSCEPVQLGTSSEPIIKRRKLNSSAVMSNAETQTPLSCSSNTLRKTKLQKPMDLNDFENKEENASLQQFKSLCDKFLPEKFAPLVKVQADLHHKISEGQRYTEEYKNFALNLYFTSPKAYNFLQKNMVLSSVRCLQRITSV